ncbi:MAG: MMPL family transporter, partial [Nitrospinaceae bacterium]|nr:MMPL family transporter [Nitrospinaceae bacterium]NIU97468.1 MMPL family transporter [Nitrospinaceae bacterium]
MELPQKWTRWCVQHPKQLSLLIFLVCLGFSLQIPRIQIDTDPENMLSREEFVRIFHNRVKRVFTLHDMIVLGVVNESHPDGVFNPGTLKTIHTLTQQIERIDGVIPIDLLAPSKVDDIQQAGLGTVRFQWLMSEPPKSREEALHIRDRARDNPLLNGTLLSEDGKALCLYIPVRSKDLSYVVSEKIRARISKLKGDEQYHITGLPVAEDTFGVEMFRQMAVSAPLAGLFLFLLMWFFFRKPVLIFSALIVAGATVVCTMGLLIGLGFTVHIMSSMIPIFLMPIAVVDSIHILSEFFDRYQDFRDRVKTMEAVMAELFRPMLFTSLTSAAGFASLALTPIPPVRVFGLFVAFGILLAWVLTITFIPAYIMFLPESSLTSFGRTKDAARAPTLLERGLGATGQRALRHVNPILGVSGVVLILSIMGITQIQVNDNPVKWFEKDHPIRVADRVLNEHFGGTYMAYLVLNRKTDEPFFNEEVEKLRADFERRTSELKPFIPGMGRTREQALLILEQSIPEQRKLEHWSLLALLEKIESRVAEAAEKDAAAAEAWNEIALFFSEERVAAQPFKNPEVLRYMESLQDTLRDTEEVGKATSVVDVVKKVHYELREGDKTYNRVPDTAAAVAQTLLSYQNSHDPDDLWHLVTPDYDKANLWIQLKSGDNRDMERVERRVDRFFRET